MSAPRARFRRLIPALVVFVLWSSSSAAQVLADDACPANVIDAPLGSCDQRAAVPVQVAELTPEQAWDLKIRRGEVLLFVDLRSHRDAARGQPEGVDAVVPFRELGVRAENPLGQPTLPGSGFIARIDSEVFSRGGGRSMPIMLICGNGELAHRAAIALQTMGYLDVSVVAGGFEGGADRAGLVAPGWKRSGLPWHEVLVAQRPEAITLVSRQD